MLSPAVGGKGVKPYQPDNIWEPLAFGGSNTRYYKQDKGESLYRRSLYTFWKRTAPPPMMTMGHHHHVEVSDGLDGVQIGRAHV